MGEGQLLVRGLGRWVVSERLRELSRLHDNTLLMVLNEVNLDVQRGQVVVLIGPSGAGKTTLLRSINHLEELSSGP